MRAGKRQSRSRRTDEFTRADTAAAAEPQASLQDFKGTGVIDLRAHCGIARPADLAQRAAVVDYRLCPAVVNDAAVVVQLKNAAVVDHRSVAQLQVVVSSPRAPTADR